MPILMADSTINCFGFYYNDICYGGDFTYQPGSNLNRIALLQNELLVSAKTKTVKDKINFFPNPSTDKIYITNNLDEPIESVKLFSADGKLILSQVNLGKQAVIQLEKPANGIYFIESINRTNSSFNKVIFE
jgi:hypothetical protein